MLWRQQSNVTQTTSIKEAWPALLFWETHPRKLRKYCFEWEDFTNSHLYKFNELISFLFRYMQKYVLEKKLETQQNHEI